MKNPKYRRLFWAAFIIKKLIVLAVLMAAQPAKADPQSGTHSFFQACQNMLTGAWKAVFPDSKRITVGGEEFHVRRVAIGEGGEGVVYRLWDEPSKKLKVFTPSSEYSMGEGRIDLMRIGPLPQGYIRGWVNKVESLRSKGLPVPVIFKVGEGYVLMEYIDGVTYKQLTRKELGYTPEQVKEIRQGYWDLVKRASQHGTLDGIDNFNNLLWDPARGQWFIIDP